MTDRCLSRGDRAPDFSFKDTAAGGRSLYAEAQGTPLFVFVHAAGLEADGGAEIKSLAEAAPELAGAGCKLFAVFGNLNDAASVSNWLQPDAQVVADPEGAIARSFGVDGGAMGFLLDPCQRVVETIATGESPIMARGLAALRVGGR